MKSLIEFPEEVAATPSSLLCGGKVLPVHATTNTLTFDDDIDFDTDTDIDTDRSCDSDCDCDCDETTTASSTITESETDSDTDTDTDTDDDENDSHYHNLSDVDDNDVDIDVVADDAATLDENINNNNNRRTRGVSFGPIHVRQYERIVGDHPDTKVGVPLSIGWAYYEDEQHPNGVSIERYESDRIRKRGNLRMSSITTKNMLLNVFGIPLQELRQAEKESLKTRKQRRKQQQKLQQTSLTISHTGISACKKVGKKIRKGGLSFLKGMTFAAQSGMTMSAGGGLSTAAEHVF